MKKTPRASKKIGSAVRSPRNTESPRTSPIAMMTAPQKMLFMNGCPGSRSYQCSKSSLALGWRTREPQLGPRDLAGLDHRPDLTLARRQRRAAGLHLEKHHTPHVPGREPIEHDEVDRTAEKACVLGIEPEFGEIGNELLVHLASGHRQAALHRIFTNRGAVAEFPDQEVQPRDHDAARDAENEAAEVASHHPSFEKVTASPSQRWDCERTWRPGSRRCRWDRQNRWSS